MSIINLTPNATTPAQREAGVQDLPTEKEQELRKLLTFETLPDPREIRARANSIANIAATAQTEDNKRYIKAMIGEPPYLMPALEQELRRRGITPLYHFSHLKHLGFIEATSFFDDPDAAEEVQGLRAVSVYQLMDMEEIMRDLGL